MIEDSTNLTPESWVNQNLLHGIPTATTKDVILEEQPHHRHAAYLFAMGASTREVADAMGVTTHATRVWLRQPWFQERVTQLMEKHGGKDIMQLFRSEALPSLAVMLEIRDNPKASATIRANVCKDILDRVLGKPTQRIETVAAPTSDDPVAEAERLEAENNRLLREQTT